MYVKRNCMLSQTLFKPIEESTFEYVLPSGNKKKKFFFYILKFSNLIENKIGRIIHNIQNTREKKLS